MNQPADCWGSVDISYLCQGILKMDIWGRIYRAHMEKMCRLCRLKISQSITLQQADTAASLHAPCQSCGAHASLIRIISTFYHQQHLQKILWPGIILHAGILLIPSHAIYPGGRGGVRLSLITSSPGPEPGQTRICKLIIRNCQYYYRIYQTRSQIKITYI